MLAATFAGSHATHHLGAEGYCLFGMIGAFLAGKALADHLGVFIDDNSHQYFLICFLIKPLYA